MASERNGSKSSGMKSNTKMHSSSLEEREKTHFIDGSEYTGTWRILGMEGIGKYVLPHGTKYEGEFRDGTFHGYASMYWTGGQRVDGIWSQGECIENRYVFNDGLIFHRNDWKYCRFPDRRYHVCVETGLRPAGATLGTNKQDKSVFIPSMCYDSGIGIFHPQAYTITSYHDSKKVLEIPSKSLARWIINNCQKGWTEPTGYREDIYENWFSPNINSEILFPGSLPFSTDSFEPWWKRLTTFQRESMRDTTESLPCCSPEE